MRDSYILDIKYDVVALEVKVEHLQALLIKAVDLIGCLAKNCDRTSSSCEFQILSDMADDLLKEIK